jgi:hypothetical protein
MEFGKPFGQVDPGRERHREENFLNFLKIDKDSLFKSFKIDNKPWEIPKTKIEDRDWLPSTSRLIPQCVFLPRDEISKQIDIITEEFIKKTEYMIEFEEYNKKTEYMIEFYNSLRANAEAMKQRRYSEALPRHEACACYDRDVIISRRLVRKLLHSTYKTEK